MGRWAPLVLLAFVASGCGRNPARLETALVRGTITIDGVPLESGVVLFAPERGRVARGELARDGSFVLSTYGRNDGAVVGRHHVAVMAWEGEPREDAPMQWLVPEKYTNPHTSGLEFEVRSGERHVADFELSRAGG